jgi:hypothetical protein
MCNTKTQNHQHVFKTITAVAAYTLVTLSMHKTNYKYMACKILVRSLQKEDVAIVKHLACKVKQACRKHVLQVSFHQKLVTENLL